MKAWTVLLVFLNKKRYFENEWSKCHERFLFLRARRLFALYFAFCWRMAAGFYHRLTSYGNHGYSHDLVI